MGALERLRQSTILTRLTHKPTTNIRDRCTEVNLQTTHLQWLRGLMSDQLGTPKLVTEFQATDNKILVNNIDQFQTLLILGTHRLPEE